MQYRFTGKRRLHQEKPFLKLAIQVADDQVFLAQCTPNGKHDRQAMNDECFPRKSELMAATIRMRPCVQSKNQYLH